MMGIQKDAGELLKHIYEEYNSSYGGIGSDSLEKTTGWNKQRLRTIVRYLQNKNFIDVHFYLGGNFYIDSITSEGIDIIENQGKFKNTFGFAINLGLFKFSWQGEKR